jgi:hypothetical protein
MYLIIIHFYFKLLDNFDFDQVSKDFKLFRNEYPRLFRKVKESILKNTSTELLSDKKQT